MHGEAPVCNRAGRRVVGCHGAGAAPGRGEHRAQSASFAMT